MATVITRRGVPAETLARSASTIATTTTTSETRNNLRPLAFSSFFPTSKASSEQKQQQHLVLVGGGHAHVQVIKALNKASRPKNLQVTLIDVQKSASYSGMVPGCISGMYQLEETLLHLEPLAEWAGIEFINDRVVDIDLDNNLITLQNGNNVEIPFDAISIDIGSTSRGLLETKGAKAYTIPTRPIAGLVQRLQQASEELEEWNAKRNMIDESKNSQQPIVDVVVIGGGAAGIELSMCVMGRWKPILGDNPANVRVTVLNSDSELLPSEKVLANREALQQILSDRGIEIRNNCFVERVEEDCVVLSSGVRIPFTHCLWATGASAHDLAFRIQEQRGLALSKHGWIRVNKHLQSVSHPQVFAAGDCCTMEGLANGKSSPPKAGVYAVRSGPILIENLTRFLAQSNNNNKEEEKADLITYRPQDDFLKLLVCGDGTALGFRFGIPIHGKWVFELKDAIDQSFMNLFKVENLPKLVEGQSSYDTSEYDATATSRSPPKESVEAAALLQRTDDNVDFQEAWNVLRDMTQDEEYRKQVLECMPVHEATLV